jgi:hypothetical protein
MREEEEKKKPKGFFLENIKYMLLMGFTLSLAHYLWQAVPYTVLFKHLTISE